MLVTHLTCPSFSPAGDISNVESGRALMQTFVSEFDTLLAAVTDGEHANHEKVRRHFLRVYFPNGVHWLLPFFGGGDVVGCLVDQF